MADDLAAKGKKRRVQLDLSPSDMARLEALKERTDATSWAEVVKKANKIYEALLDEAAAGGEFLTRGRDGVLTSLKMFL